MTPDEWVERPCAECGEPTYNERLCRDCALEELMDDCSCKRCGHFMIRRDLCPNPHAADCPNADPPCEACGGTATHVDACPLRLKGGLFG